MEPKDLLRFTFFRGRVALAAALEALGIGKGDHVATQAYTCVGLAEGILAVEAQPIYVDVEENGVNIDCEDLERKLTPQTRAIVVQHTLGIPAAMERIMKIAEQRNIYVIEDTCHAYNSLYKGQKVGSFGVASFYSFEWGKPLAAGVGGSLIVAEPGLEQLIANSYSSYRYPSLVREIRLLLQYAVYRILYRPSFYWLERSLFRRLMKMGLIEGNYRKSFEGKNNQDFLLRMARSAQCILKKQIPALATIEAHRNRVVGEYQSRIKSAALRTPDFESDAEPVFLRYPVLSPQKWEILERARRKRIQLVGGYESAVHPVKKEQLHLVGYQTGSCPRAEQLVDELIGLPTHLRVKTSDVEQIIEFLNSI